MISLSFQRSHVCAYITEVCHFSRLQYKEIFMFIDVVQKLLLLTSERNDNCMTNMY